MPYIDKRISVRVREGNYYLAYKNRRKKSSVFLFRFHPEIPSSRLGVTGEGWGEGEFKGGGEKFWFPDENYSIIPWIPLPHKSLEHSP